jgi:hypothetical protein
MRWIRVSDELHKAGLDASEGAAREVSKMLRARNVPVIRDHGRWRVRADNPVTMAWLASLRQPPALEAKMAASFRDG